MSEETKSETAAPTAKAEPVTQNATASSTEGEYAAPVLSTTAGAIAGGVATAGTATTVAGVGGVSGYASGVAATIAAATCEIAAVGTLTAIAVGPILGGLIGYTGYKVFKSVTKKDA